MKEIKDNLQKYNITCQTRFASLNEYDIIINKEKLDFDIVFGINYQIIYHSKDQIEQNINYVFIQFNFNSNDITILNSKNIQQHVFINNIIVESPNVTIFLNRKIPEYVKEITLITQTDNQIKYFDKIKITQNNQDTITIEQQDSIQFNDYKANYNWYIQYDQVKSETSEIYIVNDNYQLIYDIICMKIIGNLWFQNIEHYNIIKTKSNINFETTIIQNQEEADKFMSYYQYWNCQEQVVNIPSSIKIQQLNPFIKVNQLNQEKFYIQLGQNIQKLQDQTMIDIKNYLELHSISCQATSHPRSIYDCCLKIYELYQVFINNLDDVEYQTTEELEFYENIKQCNNVKKLQYLIQYFGYLLPNQSCKNIEEVNADPIQQDQLNEILINVNQQFKDIIITDQLNNITNISDILSNDIQDDININITMLDICYIITQIYAQTFHVQYDKKLLQCMIFNKDDQLLKQFYDNISSYCYYCINFYGIFMQQNKQKEIDSSLFGKIYDNQCLNIIPSGLEKEEIAKEFLMKLKQQNEKLYIVDELNNSLSQTTINELQQLFKDKFNLTIDFIATLDGKIIYTGDDGDKNIFVLGKIKKTIQYYQFCFDCAEGIELPIVRVFRNKIN